MFAYLTWIACINVPSALVYGHPEYLAPLVIPLLVLFVGQWVLSILGTVKAVRGRYFRIPVPFCFRLIR